MEVVQPLTLTGEDFLTLPKIGYRQYYESTLDSKVQMYNLVKYPNIQTLDDMSHEDRAMTRNSIKSIHERYLIEPEINIIMKC